MQFCIAPLWFNRIAYNWEQIKFHLQDIHNNASLNVQLLQKEIFETFSKSLPSSNNLETLAEQLADQLSGLDPRGLFQSITHSIRSGAIILIIILVITNTFQLKLFKLNKLNWAGPFSRKCIQSPPIMK